MKELKEHLKRELNISDELWNRMVQVAREESVVNKNIVLLKQENANLAFELMVSEGETAAARQEVADLNFTLMINGVI